jgi:hypothetical protein
VVGDLVGDVGVALHLIVRFGESHDFIALNCETTWRMRISARSCETILSNWTRYPRSSPQQGFLSRLALDR